jgi:hypothetical protein
MGNLVLQVAPTMMFDVACASMHLVGNDGARHGYADRPKLELALTASINACTGDLGVTSVACDSQPSY